MSLMYNCATAALPISEDVQVTLTKEASSNTVNLNLAVFLSATGNQLHGPSRIVYYTALSSVGVDWGTSSEAYKAATNFFAQTIRPQVLAIAQVFSTPQPAYLITGDLGPLSAFQAVSDGSFGITINGVITNLSSLDFSAATSLADVASIIDGDLASVDVSLYGSNQLIFQTTSTGAGSTLSALLPGASGTDISGSGFLNGLDSLPQNGYTPTGIAGEMAAVQEAASCTNQFIYGWIPDVAFRNTTDQQSMSSFVENQSVNGAQVPGILGLISNSSLAYENGSTTDIAYRLKNSTDPTRTFVDYVIPSNIDYYTTMSILARLLGVNYAGLSTTITAKFKNLPGIPTNGISSSQYQVLKAKRYNLFSLTGNGYRLYREGVMVNEDWFMDDRVNLDQMKVDLQNSVETLFVNTNKIPYDQNGQTQIHATLAAVLDRYVANGALDDYEVVETPIQQVPLANRQQRIGPPFTVYVELSGAIHQISINVIAQDPGSTLGSVG